MISTNERCGEHPLAGQNTQQINVKKYTKVKWQHNDSLVAVAPTNKTFYTPIRV